MLLTIEPMRLCDANAPAKKHHVMAKLTKYLKGYSTSDKCYVKTENFSI